jgi:hypothetical protein
MFLAVLKIIVIDVPFQAEIVEDLVANPPVVGVPEVPEESHLEVDNTYIESSAEQVAKNLEAGLPIDYYNISYNGAQLNAALQPVSVKGGARASAPGREIVEIEAGGQDIGSAVVDV